MKQNEKDNEKEKDWLYELNRLPVAGPDPDFLKDLHKRIDEEELTQKEKTGVFQEPKARRIIDYLSDLIKNKYIIIGAGLAVPVILIYLVLPSKDPVKNDIEKTFSKLMRPVPSPFINNGEFTTKKDTVLHRAESRHKIITLAELQSSVMNEKIKLLTDTILANSAKETEMFRKKFEKLLDSGQ